MPADPQRRRGEILAALPAFTLEALHEEEHKVDDRTAGAYDRWVRDDRRPPPRPPGGGQADRTSKRRGRAREQRRKRLFQLCTPKTILTPVNVVARYLASHPMWESWEWDATRDVNALMLPFAQALDRDDPLLDDARLALPLTVAGFMLYRALHAVGPRDPDAAVLRAVYDEIRQGIVIIDRIFARLFEIKGVYSEQFVLDFTSVVDAAEMLLFRVIRLEGEASGLILRCPLGTRCKVGEPFYVTSPTQRGPHPACRTAASRARHSSQARPVTPKRPKRKQ